MKALFFSATLRGAEAPVWRRFCVPMDYDFAKLHEVLQILRDLYREGTTILLITHDDGIAATARRVVRLSDGKIIADHPQEVDWA